MWLMWNINWLKGDKGYFAEEYRTKSRMRPPELREEFGHDFADGKMDYL